MNSKTAIGYVSSRVALNCYFWIFLFFLKYSDSDDQVAYSKATYYGFMLFYMLLMAAYTYFNTLVLLPRFLLKKKWRSYTLYASAFIVLSTLAYVTILKLSIYFYPQLRPEHLSILTYPVSSELSFISILEDAPGYLVVFIPWLIVFNIAGLYHHKSSEIKRMEAALSEHRETELAFLRSQVNPHFLFNTLNNLYALSLKKSELTAESILKLSSVLRYILYDTNTELVPFSTERDIMQAYIDIELLRVENQANQEFVIRADQAYSIPPLIWLPVLENLFKHTRMVDELEVEFRFTIIKNHLTVYCKNSRTELVSNNEPKQGGIGLDNLKKRLLLVYPDKHRLYAQAEGKYFITEVHIDLN